jgi:hypothetical protein
MPETLQFVGSIASSPTVRLDLNASPWTSGEETNFGSPPMRRSVSGSLVSDGEYVGASAYGNREITLSLFLRSSSNDTIAAEIQKLARELDLTMNLLKYQPAGSTHPVFFRTFRTSPDNIVWDPNTRTVTVTVPAEPFALGLREDIATATVNNNPAAGSNGLFLDLTGIKGDVETPLFIEYTDGGSGPTRPGLAIGVRSGTPYPTLFAQAESMTQSTDTSVVADPAFSGGSKSRCTFTVNPGNGTRLVTNFPALTEPAGAENWGAFRVFARVAQTSAAAVIRVEANGNAAVTLASQTEPQLVDLGVLDSRGGAPVTGGYAATAYRVEDAMAILFRAERVSGSGSLDIDYFVYVPADAWLAAWGQFTGITSTSHLCVIDGPSDSIYVATALSGATPGRIGSSSPVGLAGRLPQVRPGSNRLVIVQADPAGTAPKSNLLATAFSVTCRYWPRYTHVRPATT